MYTEVVTLRTDFVGGRTLTGLEPSLSHLWKTLGRTMQPPEVSSVLKFVNVLYFIVRYLLN